MNDNTAPQASPVPARRSWRRRLLLILTILLPLGLVLAYLSLASVSKLRLQRAVAEADRLDPGWRFPELEASRAMVRDEENSASVVLTAAKLIPAQWPFWLHASAPAAKGRSSTEIDALQEKIDSLRPRQRLDQGEEAVLQIEIGRAAAALKEARKVAELPHGRYAITYSPDIISTLLPHLQEARDVGSLLSYDVSLRIQRKDFDGALINCRAILNTAGSIGDEPLVISMLERKAIDQTAMQQIERILAQGHPSPGALQKMQQALEEEANAPLLLTMLRAERGAAYIVLQQAIEILKRSRRSQLQNLFRTSPQDSLSLRIEMLFPDLIEGDRAALLRFGTQVVEMAKLPAERHAEKLQDLDSLGKRLPPMARMTVAPVVALAKSYHHWLAHMRCSILMVASERYRQANGRWPGQLKDLVPNYLANVPLDPFTADFRRGEMINILASGVLDFSVFPRGKC